MTVDERGDDAVRRILTERGAPEWLVDGGLPALLERWGGVVRSVEEGYAFTLDDYLNDLDLRTLIGHVLDAVGEGEAWWRAEIDALDARFREATERAPCLWGSDTEWEEGHSPDREWWYYRRPARLTDELREELDAWGLL